MICLGSGFLGTVGYFVSILSNEGISTTTAAFIRLSLGAFFMFFIILLRSGYKALIIDKKAILLCVILGIFSQAIFNIANNTAISYLGVATASILLYTSPIFVTILSYILFKETITNVKIIALIVNIMGCFLMVTGGNLSTFEVSLTGVISGILASLCYSAVPIIGKINSNKIDPLVTIFYSFLFGTLIMGVIAKPWNEIISFTSNNVWIHILAFGLIPTVLAYTLYFKGLSKNVEASKASVVASTEIVVATAIGGFVFNEKLGTINYLGVLLLLGSIFMMNLTSKNVK